MYGHLNRAFPKRRGVVGVRTERGGRGTIEDELLYEADEEMKVNMSEEPEDGYEDDDDENSPLNVAPSGCYEFVDTARNTTTKAKIVAEIILNHVFNLPATLLVFNTADG